MWIQDVNGNPVNLRKARKIEARQNSVVALQGARIHILFEGSAASEAIAYRDRIFSTLFLYDEAIDVSK